MDRFLKSKLPRWSRKKDLLVLAFSWTLGLVLGLLCAESAGDAFASLVRAAGDSRVSIFGLLATVMLPFLLSAFSSRGPWVIIVIAFLKAFLVCYTGYGVMMAFGGAGWLVRLLLLFSQCCTVPVLYWFWIDRLISQRKHWIRTALPVLVVLIIGSFDYYVVSPFWAMLIS